MGEGLMRVHRSLCDGCPQCEPHTPPEKPDPRVETMARAIHDCQDNPPSWDEISGWWREIYEKRAIAAFAALESAGWRVVKLEQVGRGEPYDWGDNEGDEPSRQPWILSSHRTSDNAWPVYRITKEKP